jgi:hypothetical protein
LGICSYKNSHFHGFTFYNENNLYYWHSLMPQYSASLGLYLIASDAVRSLHMIHNSHFMKAYLEISNHTGFKFSEEGLFALAGGLFNEYKPISLISKEVLIHQISLQNIDIEPFSKYTARLISEKYGVIQRLIDALESAKDISPLHNSALFLIFEGIFKHLDLGDYMPTNFKKMVEIYLDLLHKTRQKPSVETLQFFEKFKENKSFKELAKQILL